MSEVGHGVFAVFVVFWYVVILAAFIWAVYLAYLLTRALRKYLRT